jgi:hypothetical protein
MIEAARIYVLRTARLELLLAAVAVGALTATQAWTALQVVGIALDPGCLLQVTEACDPNLVVQYGSAFVNSPIIQAAGLGIAVGVGALLGTMAVGSELESGTVQTAWWLDPHRSRWLRSRLVAFGTATLVLLLVLAVTSHWFEALRRPMFDPGASFQAYRFRGPALLGAGLAAFGVGSLVGAVVGRTLPSMVVAVVVALGLVAVSHAVVFPNLAEAVVLRSSAIDSPDAIVTSRYLDASGSVLTLDMVKARSPFDTSKQDFWDWASATFREVGAGYEGRSYWTVAVREFTLWIATCAGLIGATWTVVRRRRPT